MTGEFSMFVDVHHSSKGTSWANLGGFVGQAVRRFGVGAPKIQGFFFQLGWLVLGDYLGII